MTANSVPNAKPSISPFHHTYPQFAPTSAEGEPAPAKDTLDAHPAAQKGVVLPTEGFVSQSKSLTPATHALVRQGDVLKAQIGAGRHALQYIAAGSSALGLAVACSGHPWAGFAVAAIGTLVGFGVQAYVRHRALKKVGANGVSGEQFKAAFEGLLKEHKGVINDPALETSRKVYDFLTRSTWGDCKHDLLQPSKRAAVGAASLARAGLRKVFNAQPPVVKATKAPEATKQPDAPAEGDTGVGVDEKAA